MKTLSRIVAIVSALTLASAAHAAVVDFTGGTAYLEDEVGGGTVVPNGATATWNVDYYEENGFKLDFIGNETSSSDASAYIGPYYGGGNDVIHSHWKLGGIGQITQVVGSKIGGGTFDLNYFILTSNTDTGGGAANGTELAYISHDGGLDPIKLPSENWGFPATAVYLPSSYDAITTFEVYVENDVDCFGMDEFYIDEPAPPGVPDTGSALPLLGVGIAALAGFRTRMARK